MNAKLLTLVLALGTLLAVPGVASATHADFQVILARDGCFDPNVPDCIDLAAALAKWASNFVGETACDILCDDDGNLLVALAAAN